MANFTQDVLDTLVPMLYDPATDPLTTYVSSLCLEFELIEDWVSDTDNGEVGWSLLVDVTRCPDEALPWLAQLVGVRLIPGLSADDQRQQIEGLANWKRGTAAAMAAAPKPWLTGTQTVIFRERYDGSANDAPYYMEVAVQSSECTDATKAEAAVRAQKPAGIILTFMVLMGQDYTTLNGAYASYDLVKAAYMTYTGVKSNLVGT